MPSQPPPFGNRHVREPTPNSDESAAAIGQLTPEISGRKPISMLDPRKHLKALHRTRQLRAFGPAVEGLAIELLLGTHDRSDKMSATVPVTRHLKGERLGE